MTTFTLIMFVLLANGSQTAVRVGFEDQLACVTAGKAMQQGFLGSPETATAKVVWSCNPSSMQSAAPLMPPMQEEVPQPPPRPERRTYPRRQAKTPPAEPAPALTEESARRALPEWLGGTRQ